MINNKFGINSNQKFQNIFQKKSVNQDNLVSKTLEKFSATYELKTDKNDISPVSKEMEARINYLESAQTTTNSVLDVASAALVEIDSVLDTMIDLVTVVADGTITDEEDIKAIQNELMSHADEIDAIAENSKVGGASIFDGSFSQGSNLSEIEYDFTGTSAIISTMKNAQNLDSIDKENQEDEENIETDEDYDTLLIENIKAGEIFSFNGKHYNIVDQSSPQLNENAMNGTMELIAKEMAREANVNVAVNETGDGFIITEKEALEIENNGDTYKVSFDRLSAESLGLRDIDITKPGGADEALSILDNAKKDIAERLDDVNDLYYEIFGFAKDFEYDEDSVEEIDNSTQITDIIKQTQLSITNSDEFLIAHNELSNKNVANLF